MKLRIVLLALFVCSLCAPRTFAQPTSGRPGAFLRMGVGARALALGGTFVALANDPSASFWNPAGLAQLHQTEIMASYFRMPSDRTHYYASGVLPVGRVNSLGVSWISLGISQVEARSGNTAAPDYLFSNSANALLISAARQINAMFSVGVNAKLISQSLDKSSAFGLGFDAAVFVYPSRYVKFGLAVQDVNTSVKWNTGWREAFPVTVRGGASVNLAENFLVALDAIKVERAGLDFSTGAEYTALEMFPIRIGYSIQGVVGGLGLAVPMRSFDFRLDYAYSDDLLEASRSNKISFGMTLAQRKAVRNAEYEIPPMHIESRSEPERLQPAPIKQGKQNYLEVLVRAVKVVEAPAASSKKVAIIKKGERYRKLAAAPSWYQIELAEGKTAWVKRKYVKEIKK